MTAYPCLPGCPFKGISYCIECAAGHANLRRFGHVDGSDAAREHFAADLERALATGRARRTAP